MKSVKKIAILCLQLGASLLVVLFVLGVGLYLRTSGAYPVEKTVAQDSTIPHVILDGITFHAETFGDSTRPKVLVLHGGPGNDYRYLLPLTILADSFYMIFYDQRGTGLSPRVSKEQQTLDSSLADVARFVDHYSPNAPIHIVGHSWGAMLASGFTARYPDRVKRVVLAEPGILTSEMGEKFKKKFAFKPSFSLLKAFVVAYFESLHIKQNDGHERKDYIFQRVASENIDGNPMKEYFCDGDPNSAFMPYWRYSLDANLEIQKGGMKDGMFDIDLVSGIENYRDTVLFITSSCNRLIGSEHQKEHMKHFPRVTHVEIDNVGHTMFGEKPEESATIIRSYLSRWHEDATKSGK